MSEKDFAYINELMKNLTSYFSLLIIIVGMVGGFGNIIIFTSRKLRTNSCAFYLLCSTIFDLIYLLLSSITRLINDYFFLNQSIFFCKCRIYLVVVIPTLSTYFIMLATIDRCLSTSTSKKSRHLNKVQMAWRISILTLIFSLVSTSHILFFFQLKKKGGNNNNNECVPDGGIYRTFISFYFFLINPLVVYTIMLICTIGTLIRIRTSRYRMRYLYNQRRNRKYRYMNRHLITIMIFQVGLGMLFTFIRCGFLIYSFWTSNINKDYSKFNVYFLLDRLSLLIYYMNFAKSFPLNTLTSHLFRQIFVQKMKNFIKWMCTFNQQTI
jgi:hypothetical protein